MTDRDEDTAGGAERGAQCQDDMERLMRQIITEANMLGWGSIEALNAMQVVLKKLQLTFAEDPGPGSPPVTAEADQSHDGDPGGA